MSDPNDLLDTLLAEAQKSLTVPAVKNKEIAARIEAVCRCPGNRAGVRLLMACLLAKLHRPEVDPRKPYTEIADGDVFSGRTYDEQYLTRFINRNRLPCNPTTAFLTPALRNIDRPLTTEVEIVGRPRQMYRDTLQLLDDVYARRVSARHALKEVIRILVLMREEKSERMRTLLASLQRNADALPLSSEDIVKLIQQHLACKNSSRLPVLLVAAAYQTASACIGETIKPLQAHNAADEQTGALGDIEVFFVCNEERVVTAYEMKMKRVTAKDIDRAVQKIASTQPPVDNYIFITTDVIDDEVREYAAHFYAETGGVEIAVLDCVGFVRHFLHLFHRSRTEFLNSYQALLLQEPESAVSQPLKEAFLALRQAAETDE